MALYALRSERVTAQASCAEEVQSQPHVPFLQTLLSGAGAKWGMPG